MLFFAKLIYNNSVMKKITKIICTIGPACATESILKEMNKEGMDIARLNMSHGNHESHQKLIDEMVNLRNKNKIKLMIDTKGPEIRIGYFENGAVNLEAGQQFVFTTRDIIGNEKEVGTMGV